MTNSNDTERRQLLERLKNNREFLLAPGNKRRLEKICEEVERIWNSSRPPYPHTPHDHTHSERVEEKLYQLLGVQKMKEKLSDNEIFLLLASVWLHDMGMNPELFDKDERHEDETKTKEWDKKVRKEHHERSGRYIRKEGASSLGLTGAEINHLVKMCLLHRHRAYKELYSEPWITKDVHIPLLTAYLRLADSLHIPYRAETREFKIYVALGMDPISRFHWLKSKFADSITVSPDNFNIIITLKKPESNQYPKNWEDDMEPLKRMTTREIQNELDSIKDILSKGGLPVYLTVDCNFTQDVNMSERDVRELKELLGNIELLIDPEWTPNASAVIDVILKQIGLFLDSNNPTMSVTYLEYYKTNVLGDILEKRPCHVFLWKIADMLEEKLKDNRINNGERIEAIQRMINEWEEKREEAKKEIPKIAYGKIADGFPVLVYGYSDTIVNCLEYYLKEKKRDIEVYICEGRTKTTYRYNNRLVYCDGIRYAEQLKKTEKKVNEELKDKGVKEEVRIKIRYVTDSCASNLFSRNKIARVLFGANGIGLGGRVSHTLGHLAIADMASIYRIPVFVIADSMKIGFLQERPELSRGNTWLTTDIEFESELGEFESCNYNPREDVIPPDRVEEIITEKGQIKPMEIARYAENTGTR